MGLIDFIVHVSLVLCSVSKTWSPCGCFEAHLSLLLQRRGGSGRELGSYLPPRATPLAAALLCFQTADVVQGFLGSTNAFH